MDLSKKDNGIVGKNALRYANDILKTHPEFKVETPIKKKVK